MSALVALATIVQVMSMFASQEYAKIVELVAQLGPKQWTAVAEHLIGRTGKQCRER